ncbi:nuclear transport factor 2 family protein [Kineosporia babensis]|uniref:Nuclear transport factor 2 family protein n=1 Tax=Kineosporia babensis TaxID=499548 RepID=A0A9X1ND42_9ACTN|nr:nuclear transport factor 2 family protein [Kineosporia babensis]MCD5311900.1 nuclear transport factor 2 family protein [Kineosporia babensis]
MNDTARTREVARAYVERSEQRDWAGLAQLLAEDMVYEMPQTGERIRSRERFLQFNREYPGDWHLSVGRIVADGANAAVWMQVSSGSELMDACAWLELSAQGLITRVTDFWPEAYEPPAGREHLVERFSRSAT